jgi:transposase
MYDTNDIERVRALLRDGWSKAAIAKHLRISRRVIYNWSAAGLLTRDVVAPRVRAGSGPKVAADEQTQRAG